jgi:hypothetical protein
VFRCDAGLSHNPGFSSQGRRRSVGTRPSCAFREERPLPVLPLFAAAALATAAPCEAAPGAERAWVAAETRIVLVGEVHGTREAPQAAGWLLCAAARKGPAVLALEAPPGDGQAQMDAYLASAGTAADREALRQAPMWRDRVARGSTAVLDLVEAARRLGVRVVLYDITPARSGPTDAGREQGMAEALARAAASGRVVALTGLGHADREGFTSFTPFVASAAQRLPRESTVALAPIMTGGEAWSCRTVAPATTPACQAHALPVRRPVAAAGVVLDPGLRAGFDGGYSVGGQFTASPPAAWPG